MNSEIRQRFFDAFPRYLAAEVDAALTIVPPHIHPPSPDNIGPVCEHPDNFRTAEDRKFSHQANTSI